MKKKAAEAAEYIQKKRETLPKIAYLTGTGLGEIPEKLEIQYAVDYTQIPHFPVPTVKSHRGRLISGRLQNVDLLIFQGRLHLYEGFTPQEVVFPIRLMQELGVEILIISNASGGLNENFRAGDIMMIRDHINLTATSPLIGPNEDAWGVRFPDMTEAYDKTLMEFAVNSAQSEGLYLKKGVYAGLKGPSLETPAEIRFLKTIGADAVGFSTVMEVLAAVHANMRILGLSLVTNVHRTDHPQKTTLESVLEVAKKASPRLDGILAGIVNQLKNKYF
jgi:purine-nucleoside phosphorylase